MPTNTFYNKFIIPFKIEYLIIGALIVIFGALNSVFGEGSTYGLFLLSLTLFFIVIFFLIILSKIFLILNGKEKGNFIGTIFFFSYFAFVLVFFVASYQKFENLFKPFFGIAYAFFILFLLGTLRDLHIVILNKIKISRKFWNIFVKKIAGVALIIILLILWIIIFYQFGTNIDFSNYTPDFNFWFIFFSGIFFVVAIIGTIIDMFHKNPPGSKNISTWKDLRIVDLFKMVVNYSKRRYTIPSDFP